MKVVENTFPIIHGVSHAEKGDEVFWILQDSRYKLIRKKDNEMVFSTGIVDKYGKLSDNKIPIMLGVIAEVKSRNWKFVIAEN